MKAWLAPLGALLILLAGCAPSVVLRPVTKDEVAKGSLVVLHVNGDEPFISSVGFRIKRFNPGGPPSYYWLTQAGKGFFYAAGLPEGVYLPDQATGVTGCGLLAIVACFYIPFPPASFMIQDASFFRVDEPASYYWGSYRLVKGDKGLLMLPELEGPSKAEAMRAIEKLKWSELPRRSWRESGPVQW